MAASGLQTARTVLRPLGASDLDAVHALWTDPEVRRYLWDGHVISRERAAEAMAESDENFRVHGYGLWGVSVEADGPLAGFCGCRTAEGGEPELLYGLLPAWWGRGLATECAGAVLDHLFGPLGHAEVVAATDAPNTASMRVMDRLGMRVERRGEHRGLDTVFYRLRAVDWHARRAPLAGVVIRRDAPSDADALWAILQPVIAAGETYAYPRDMTREAALSAWHPLGGRTFVAELDGRLAGTYLLKPNQAGPGSHVANCGYMVASWARGRRLGEALCRHSIETARALGFRAMQFNSVVSTNRGAIAVWQRCGFAIVGTVPQAFAHPIEGLVDIHVMHRAL